MSETTYLKNNYGSCKIGDECVCIRQGWQGMLCPNWQPTKAKTINELLEIARRQYVEDKSNRPDRETYKEDV